MVRQLTAIMFTDMVGYTALMQENEHNARAKRDRQRAVLEASVTHHGGQVLETYGDGSLSVFPSAVQAVLSAMDIQRTLQEEPKVPLRIGVHSGDVVHDEGGVFGDGVNVASRIQGLSASGGILISEKVYDEVKNQPEIACRPMGSFELKNVKRPMPVYAVEGPGLAVPSEAVLAARRCNQCHSVAVLPFVNMSSDPENEFFSDGVTEEIINALTRVQGLQVTARTSSFAYKNRNEDVRRIGAELGTGTILEGSVRKAGRRVRITAQLIETRDGYHLFSETWDRSIEDIFETQDEIAAAIVERLQSRLMGEDAAAPGRRGARIQRPRGAHTHDTEAYTEYLKGLHEWHRWTPEGARAAIRHYERSAEMDPHCALPWSGMASAFTFLGSIGHVPPRDAFERAEAAARKAVELEDGVGESHLALAAVQLFYHWDFDAAYRSFQKALSLIPGSAEAHHLYALHLKAVGDLEEAVEEMETAVQLDPLSPHLNHTLAQIYFSARRTDEALRQVRRTLELDPDFRSAHETLGWILLRQGRLEEAAGAFEEIPARTGDPYKVVPARAYVYARMGRDADAEEMGRLLEKRQREHPDLVLTVDRAILSLAFGRTDDVFEHLNQAADQRLGTMVFMAHSPVWDEIRDDPRYLELMSRVGVETPVPA